MSGAGRPCGACVVPVSVHSALCCVASGGKDIEAHSVVAIGAKPKPACLRSGLAFLLFLNTYYLFIGIRQSYKKMERQRENEIFHHWLTLQMAAVAEMMLG